jgi:hypothetical protein
VSTFQWRDGSSYEGDFDMNDIDAQGMFI